MPLEVTFPDGSVQQFEDGTHPDVIRSAWRGAAPAGNPEPAVPDFNPTPAPASAPEFQPWPTDPLGYVARGTTELLKGVVPGAASSVTSLVDTTGAIADFIRRRAGMEPGPLREVARNWQQTAESWFPAHPEADLTRAVGQGVGQVGETVLEALATGGGSLLPKAETLGARLLAGKQAAKAAGRYAAVRMAPAEFSDAYQRALDLGQDPDSAFAKSLGYATVAAMLEDRLGAGKLVRKVMSPELAGKIGSSTVGRFVRDALNNVTSNALEEGSQRLAQDLIVEGRPTTGIGSEALVGGIVGALVGAPGSVRTAVQRATPELRAQVAEQIAKETDPARKAALEEYQGRLADIPDAKPRKLSFEEIAAKEFGAGVEFIPEAKPVPVYRGAPLELTSTTPFGELVGDVQPMAGTYAMPGAGGLTVNVTPERVDVAGATPEMLPRIAGALVQQNLVKPVVDAGPLTEDLKAEVAKVQSAPRFQVDAEMQGDKLRVYLPAIRNRQHLKEILREERAHTRIATPEGQAALAEFTRTSPLSADQYQKLVDDGYAARPGESDQEHKARLTDEFLAKLNRDPKWKQWSQTAVAWVKKTFGLSLTTEQAGRLVLRGLRNVAPVRPQSSAPLRESLSPEAHEDFGDREDRAKEDFLSSFYSGSKHYKWPVISASRIKRIWLDFGKSGVVRDEKGMQKIADDTLGNVARLYASTAIGGHDSFDPREEWFQDQFSDAEWEKFVDHVTTDPDTGGWRLSDYAFRWLMPLYGKLYHASTAEDQLYAVDKILNVVHQRNDLASLFVEGGTKTLTEIANQGGYRGDSPQFDDNGRIQDIRESISPEGVRRVTFRDGTKVVGTARVMGNTLGVIEVRESSRRQGYGLRMLRALESKYGVNNAIAGSDAGRGLLTKAGWINDGGERFSKPGTPRESVFPRGTTVQEVKDDIAAGGKKFLYHQSDVTWPIINQGLKSGGLAKTPINEQGYGSVVHVFDRASMPAGGLNDVALVPGYTPVKPVASFTLRELGYDPQKQAHGARAQELGDNPEPPLPEDSEDARIEAATRDAIQEAYGDSVRESISPERLVQQATEQFPTAPRFQLGDETKFQGDHISLDPNLAKRPEWDRKNEIVAAVMEAGVNLLPAKALSEDLYYRLNRAEPARMAAAARALGVDVGTEKGRKVTAASVLMQHVHDARLGGRIGSWIPSWVKPDFGLMDSGSLSSVARLASTLGLSLLGNRGARGLLAARQVLQGIVEAAKQTEALPSPGVDQAQVAADLARHDIRTYQPWLDFLRGQAGELEAHSYERKRLRTLASTLDGIADQGRSRVVGDPTVGLIDTPEGPAPVSLRPSDPNFPAEMEAVGRALTEQELGYHAEYLAELAARRAVQLLDAIDGLSSTIAYLEAHEARADLAAAREELGKLNEALNKLGEQARSRAIEIRASDAALPHADAARRALADPALLDVAARIDQHAGRELRPETALTPQEQSTLEVAAAATANQAWIFRDRVLREAQAFRDKVYLPGMAKLRTRLLARLKTEGELSIAMHEVMAAAEGEAEQAGTLTGRAAAEALRDRDTAIIRFAEALARSAPDTEVGALRTALLAGGLELAPPGTVQAAAREAGISTEAVGRILDLLRTSPEFTNATVRLHDVASERVTRATISAIERIEEALRAQAQAEAKAEVGTPEDRVEGRKEAIKAREQAQAVATAHLRALNRSAKAVRRDVHDLQSQIAELEVQREHHDLLSDVADSAVTELPNIRRMVYEFQDGIKLDAFGTQPEVTIRPGQAYDSGLVARIAEWMRSAREQLDAVDPQTRRGLLVALGDETTPSLVGALVDLNATPETIAKTLAPSYPIDWLSRKGFFRTKEILSRLVPGIWSSRILSTERNLVDVQRKVDLLQAREGAHRHKLLLQAFKSLDLDARTLSGQMKFRAVYNEFANELRQHESGVEAGQKVWSSGLEGRVLTPELITLLRNDRRVGRLGQTEAEKLPYGGVRENLPGRQVVRKHGETGDIGLARLVDGSVLDLLAAQYEAAPRVNGQVTDRSAIDVWWSSADARDALRSHVRSASRTDMSTTRSPAMRTAEQTLTRMINTGRVELASLRTVEDWAGAIQRFLPETVDAGAELRAELDQYGAIALSRRQQTDGGPLQSTFTGRGEGDTTEFTSAAAQLAFPPSWYNYGAVDGLRSMLARVADPAQVEYLASLKDAAANLNTTSEQVRTALKSPDKDALLEALAPVIRWHTTGLFTGQTVTDQRAEAAANKMRVRAGILMQEYERTLNPRTDPIGRFNKLLSNVFPFLLLRLTAWASNVFGGPIALQPIFSRFFGTPSGTAMSLGSMGLSAGSMVYNIARDLGEYVGAVPHSEYQTFLDDEGVGSNFDRLASGEQEAFATGTLPRSRVQRGLDVVKSGADKASEYVGVRRGDRDLNLLIARRVGPAILRRLRTLAASPEVPLKPGVREWLSKFGNPEEVLALAREVDPAKYYESKLGRRMVYALIEEANASTKVNRPNPNSLLALMGWTTHMLQLLADETRVTPDATRAQKARKAAVVGVLGAVAMSAAYYVQILGRRAMNEAVSNTAGNLAVLLSGVPKDVEDPDALEKLLNLLAELNGAIRSHVWAVGTIEDAIKAPIEALGRASVPAATLTPLHPDFWDRDWQDVAGDLAMSVPKGIGLNSVQLPSLGILEQVVTAGAQAGRGVKTIASNPSSAAQRAGGLEDLSTAGRNALNLLGLVGATISELAFPGGNAGRASRSQITNAANQLGIRVEPGFQSGGWLNPTPVRKGLLAAGRELVEATTPEQVDAAESKISALTQFVAERAEKRALDKGDDAATAKQAGIDAVKRILPDLNPYRHAIGRPLTEKELADLRSKVGDKAEVSRDEQAAQAVTRAASRKYRFPVSRGMKSPVKRKVRARVLTLR